MKEDMNKIISPLSADIAKVDKTRSEDKAKNDTNLKNLADKLNNDIEILKAEHSAQTLEFLEKVDSIQKLVTDKSTPVPNSWANIVSSSPCLSVPRAEPGIPTNDGNEQKSEKVESIMNEAKTVIGLQPITDEDIEILMEERSLEKEAATFEYIYAFLEGELGVENVKSELEAVKFFRPEKVDPNREQDRLYVQFASKEQIGKIFLHVKKISNPEVKVMPYIPPSFSKRFRKMGNVAHSLRHASIPVKTSIRWGQNDLILQQKKPEARLWETVLIPDLTPVELNPLPPSSTPSSSPAPGLKRKKRKRSSQGNTSPSQPENKSSKNDSEDNDKVKEIPKDQFTSKKDHFEALFSPWPGMIRQRSSSSSSSLPLRASQPDIRKSLLAMKPPGN